MVASEQSSSGDLCDKKKNLCERKMEKMTERLREFMENEARSGSMDFGCITPQYVYRMWGRQVPLSEIEDGLRELREQGFMNLSNHREETI